MVTASANQASEVVAAMAAVRERDRMAQREATEPMGSSRHIIKLLGCVVALTLLLVSGLAQATVPPTTNFAKATVSTGYNSSATSIIVSAGQGAKFSASGTYPLVWWNCTDYALSEDDPNVEIILVTSRSTDTLTITRGADGTTAVNHNTAGKTYCLVRSLVKYDIDAIRSDIGAAGGSIPDVYDAASYASFNAAVTALCANTDPKVLRLSNAQTVASSTSLCANVKLWRIGSGRLTVSGGATVTLDNPQQIIMPYRATLFDGASTQPVLFTNPGTVYPEYWNWDAATSAANGTTRFKMMIDSLPADSAKASVIDFAGVTYLYEDKIPTNSRNIWLKGLNKVASHVLLTGTGSVKHGIYCTGTTNFLRVTDLDWSPQTAHTVDNFQTGIRCDGAGDAPSMPAGSVLEVWDVTLNGWNIAVGGDGDTGMKLARATVLRSEITVGGTGSLSAVNEGINLLRAELLKADSVTINGASKADHCLYALSVRALNFTNNACRNSANEGLKVISISTGATAPNPRLWTLDNNTVTDSGECAVITTDQDDVLDLVSLNNFVCDGVTGAGSDTAAFMIQALGTSTMKLLRMDGVTCSNSIHGCVYLDTVSGATIDHVSISDAHFTNWSTSSVGAFAAIFSNSAAGTKRLLKYSGYFDGATNGRQILGSQMRESYWTAIDAGPVIARRMVLADENILTAQIGNGATRGRVPTAIGRTVTTTGTPASTTETTLATIDIPAGTFCANGKTVRFRAAGAVAANANTKMIRLKVNGTTYISNDVTTAPNNTTWRIDGEILRQGLNTQVGTADMIVGSTNQTHKIINSTGTENAAIAIAVTGQNGTASANDIILYSLTVDYGN